MSTMKPLRSIAMLAIGVTAGLFATSCHHVAPNSASQKLYNSSVTEVYGFNGSMAPASRQFQAYGPIPEKAKAAMVEYLKDAKWKTADYIHPQQFIQVDNAGWILCTSTNGQLVGFLVPERATIENVKKFPTCGNYKLLVNETPEAPALAYEILKGLQHSDAYRQSIRKRLGLEPTVLTEPASAALPQKEAPKAPAKQSAAPTPKADSTANDADETGADKEGPVADGASSADTTDATAGSDDIFGEGATADDTKDPAAADDTKEPAADDTSSKDPEPAADPAAAGDDPF